MFKRLKGTVITVVALNFTLWMHISVAQTYDVTVNLGAAKKSLAASDSTEISFSITNDSDQTVSVLRWYTPFENRFSYDSFEVRKDGKVLSYKGRLIKRLAPTQKDYIPLLPGETISTTVDISQGYDITESGRYEIRFRDRALRVQATTAGSSTNALQKQFSDRVDIQPTIRSNTLELTLSENRADNPISPFNLPNKAAAFQGCDAGQQSIINSSLDAARNITQTALDDLINAPVAQRPTALRYTTWFGSYDVSRYNSVVANFSAIDNVLDNKTVTFNCSACLSDPDYSSFFAYVFPFDPINENGPFPIYLCGVFWEVDTVGTDSRAGTIVHEVSHFQFVALTDDWAYGQTAAQALAINDPTSAINNADSHEYFAENTPFLTMPVPASPLNLAPVYLLLD